MYIDVIYFVMFINRGNDNGLSVSFNGGINIFILVYYYIEINYVEIVYGKYLVEYFIINSMVISINDVNNNCWVLYVLFFM